MIYLLDTNTCIQYLTGKSASVIQRFKTVHRQDIYLCDVVKSELYYGAYKSFRKENIKDDKIWLRRSATTRVLAISSDQISGTNALESTMIANMELA
ncbi:MAG: PIN domain-containing protein [Nostocales cyanobacterium ELA583]|jgi:predicted nucleic acid-binding protein